MVDCCSGAVKDMFGRCLDICLLPCRSSPDKENIISNEQEEEEQGIDNIVASEPEEGYHERENGVVLRRQLNRPNREQQRISLYGHKIPSDLNEEDEVKKDLIMLILKNREDEYTKTKNYSVFCGTWNVNGQNPPNSDLLNKWLKEGFSDMGEETWPPDIFVIGFQEVGKFFWGSLNVENEWRRAVQEVLLGHARYREVKSTRMARIMMIVYVKESLMTEDVLSDCIDAGKVATGIMGSKGGVGVRINIYDASLCFINTHLAAHQEKTERRNEDYRNVERKMQFENVNLKIFDHDTIFWIGDLNYRIDEIDINEVKTKITKKEYSDLLREDQLRKQLGTSDVFQGYTEGKINFKPTYKYDKDSNVWDSSSKRRKPAWCDRILYKGLGVKQFYYNSHSDILISDHKPVSSLFHVEVKVPVKETRQNLIDDIKNNIQNLVETYKPKVKCDRTQFQFKDVLFFEAKSETLTVENEGPVPVMFRFDECKPWLTVTPSRSVIKSGTSCKIRFDVLVNETYVASTNASNYKLNDTLKLFFVDGESKDIKVDGNVMPSSFGYTLKALVQIREPIRNISTDKLQPTVEELSKYSKQNERRLIVPKEVIRLTKHISDEGKGKKKLFQHVGLQEELKDIRECLDTTLEGDIPGSINSVAEALLLFLKCLPEPVIPSSVHGRCLKASSNYKSCEKAIKEIDPINKDLFEHLCNFLTEMICSDENVLDINIISSIFGDVLIRNGEEDADNKKKEFIAFFLEKKIEDEKLQKKRMTKPV